MALDDVFGTYSPETKGDLEEYLREHDGSSTDNLFYGPEYFFIIRDKGFMIPGATCVRVDLSPIPDVQYFVNPDFLLESDGPGAHNMSCVGAEKGAYDPKDALRDKMWSISGLKI